MKNYSIKRTGVTHDVFDDEIVALNLVDGKYYSMEGVAAVIWQSLKYDFNQAEIAQLLLRIQGSDDETVGSDVNKFLQQIENEGLVVESGLIASQNDAPSIQLPERYEAPVLHIFTDMQEVIALDPVHDVSDKGWPLKSDGSTR